MFYFLQPRTLFNAHILSMESEELNGVVAWYIAVTGGGEIGSAVSKAG